MKLYFHPVSTASRPVLLFCAESNINFEPVVVDLMTGEHLKEPFTKINPSSLVPAIEDEGFVLTESSAILKYIAEKHGSSAYPKDLRQRAKINEAMDWFNTQLYREYGYHLVYPQIFGHHKRPTEDAQKGTVDWGLAKSNAWLKILDEKLLGPKKFLCGDQITIADYFGAEILAAGDVIGAKFDSFPNVNRWMATMRALPSWKKVHEATDGFAAMNKDKPFVRTT